MCYMTVNTFEQRTTLEMNVHKEYYHPYNDHMSVNLHRCRSLTKLTFPRTYRHLVLIEPVYCAREVQQDNMNLSSGSQPKECIVRRKPRSTLIIY